MTTTILCRSTILLAVRLFVNELTAFMVSRPRPKKIFNFFGAGAGNHEGC